MPNTATTRERRLRKTKAQLIDEIDTLEQRAAAIPEGGSELKRREEELAEKEAQLRLALDNMPGGIMLVDRDLNSVLINPQYSELHDYPDGLLKVGGSMLDELRYQVDRGDFGPGDKDDLIEELVANYQRGEAVSYERAFAGSGRTLQFNVAPTPEGGYVSIITDITERKRAEAELAEKEAQLRLALDNMPGGIRLVDGNKNYVFFNSRYCEMYDFPEGLLKVGESNRVENLYQAKRGDFGSGDPEALTDDWLVTHPVESEPISWERTTPSGKILQVSTSPTPDGGVVNIVTDITERKRAEEELAEKEAQFRLALDNMSGGIRLVDKDRRYVFFNSRYSELYDFPEGLLKVGESTRVENLYQAKRGDFGPGDPEALTDEWLGLHAVYSEPASWEERMTPAGNILEISTSPTPDGGVVNIVTDITERKRAEAELAEKEVHLRIALDNMPGGMRLVDKDLKYVFFNSRYCELYEFPEGLLKVGGSIRVENFYQAQRGDFGPGDPAALTDEWLGTFPVKTKEPANWERTTVSRKILQANTSPTPDGGIVNIVTDITERKRAEAELAEKEAQFRLALDNMSGGIRLVDKDRRYVFFNSRYSELYDFPEGLLKVGESTRVENLYQAKRGDFGPGDPEALTDEWLGLHAVYSEPASWEERMTPTGNILEISTSPTPDGGVVNIVTDITERKRAEEDIAAKETQLRIVLDNMPDGIRCFDKDNNFCFSIRGIASSGTCPTTSSKSVTSLASKIPIWRSEGIMETVTWRSWSIA